LMVIFVIPFFASAITITTNDATLITSEHATLNGSIDPMPENNLLGVWFSYAPENYSHSTCQQLATVGGTGYLPGITSGTFQKEINFVVNGSYPPGKTYYYCAGASYGSNQTIWGAMKSFYVPGPPPPSNSFNITTQSATDIGYSGATLSGTFPANNNLLAYFKYSDTQFTTCSDPSNSISATSLTSMGSSTQLSKTVTTLSPNKTYYYCAIAYKANTNPRLWGWGTVKTFKTPAIPSVSSGNWHQVHTASNATNITDKTATLSGSAIAIPIVGFTTPVYGYFRYSPVAPGNVSPIFCNEVFGDDMKSTKEDRLDINTPVGVRKTFWKDIYDLEPNTTYFYCAVASEKADPKNNIIEYGRMESFTTAPSIYSENPLSSIETKPATGIGSNSAYLNGFYNTMINATTWFEYRKKLTYEDIKDSFVQQITTASIGNLFSLNSAFSVNSNANLSKTNPTYTTTNTQSITASQPNSILSGLSSSTSTASGLKIPNPYNWSGKLNPQSHLAGTSGAMSYFLKNLEKNTTYEFRAGIQTNISGNNPQTSYGNILSFRTSSSGVEPGDVPHQGDDTETYSGDLTLDQIIAPPDYAIVRYHEGVEHVFVKQLVNNLELAKTLGYREEMNLETFAWDMADFLARTFGYVSQSGKEVRVSPPDRAAYQINLKNGQFTIYEYFDSRIIAIRNITSVLKSKYYYEYYFTKKVN
ncbi:MAG: hypothetical protein ABH951_02360, partial [Patescibacteria group bacterium]